MEKINLCHPPIVGMNCFGCCGDDYKEEELDEAIRKNTEEWSKAKGDMRKFLKKPLSTRKCGVCRNVVIKEEVPGKEPVTTCPLHPAENDGFDFRASDKYCDRNYNCKTKKEFEKWDFSKQVAFLEFIKKKNLNHIAFSLRIDNGELLKEFKTCT